MFVFYQHCHAFILYAVYRRGGQHWLKGLEPNKLINQRASKYDWILLRIDIKSMKFQALFHETGDYGDSWPSGIFSPMHSARATIGGSWPPPQRIFSPDCSVGVESKLWEESWLFQLLSMSKWWRQLCSWETSQRHLLSSKLGFHVQWNEFTTGRPQSGGRRISRMIKGKMIKSNGRPDNLCSW